MNKQYLGKDAKGLMQIKDIAAQDVSGDSSKLDLHDVNTNINLGTLYFSNLIKRYNGNYYLAICAYNAGMGNVDSWIQSNKITYSFNDDDINSIPFKETKNYLSKVIHSYKMYKILYN